MNEKLRVVLVDDEAPARLDPDRPPLDAVGDAVLHGVLHQRLQQQRRHQAAQRPLIGLLQHAEPRAEAYLLDRQVAVGQGHFVPERHSLAAAQAQALPQEVPEQLAHPPRRLGVGRGQRADRVEAVEEKVRVELGAQGA